MNRNHRIGLLVLVLLSIPGLLGLAWRANSTALLETDLSNHVVWGLTVSLYLYFLGLSAGGFVLSSLVYGFGLRRLERIAKLAVLQAFVCMLVGVALIWTDLGRPLRFINVFLTPNPLSALTWVAFTYVIYLILLLGELVILRNVSTTDQLARQPAQLLKILALVGTPIAVSVPWVSGALLAIVKARPEWNTGSLPVASLASAAVSGTALLMVLAALFDRKDEVHRLMMDFLARLAAGLLVFELLLLASEALVVLYGGVEEEIAAYRHLYFGPYWYVCWIVHLLLGSLIPLGIFLVPQWRRVPGALVAAAVLVVLGTVGYRLNIVIPAQIEPVFRQLPTAYYHVRNVPEYFPTLAEWLASLGVIVAGCWLFWLGRILLERRSGQVA